MELSRDGPTGDLKRSIRESLDKRRSRLDSSTRDRGSLLGINDTRSDGGEGKDRVARRRFRANDGAPDERERERQSPDGPRFVGLSGNHRMIDTRYHRRGGRGEIIRRTAAPVSGFLLATRRLPEPTVHRHRDRFLPDQRGWVGHVGWPPSNRAPSISKSWPLDFQHGKSLATRRERETKKPTIGRSEPSVSLSSTAVTMRS